MKRQLYGIWCKDTNDWLRESAGNESGIIAFYSRSVARVRAGFEYGQTYAEAKRNDWCEVRPLVRR